jgi:hypothetical protein
LYSTRVTNEVYIEKSTEEFHEAMVLACRFILNTAGFKESKFT